ncbi:hypothetical protein CDQ84_12590 [Clostridium thermosuccinogenes]|jgi:hypothetical protein|uniref:Uncharacterized protein n=1 Tax=Clostridium thermosuccinogenes TaxID=84032 RepID=A0A2K2F4H9_9CLOT|nr:hypothetical protein [Pseudoclostridium thermosuccinogenes]AUS97370.1 hypothetical protein CDO33_13540 [Pseudoclostridium thermosuccinogenes]PNT93707.1 hypothetical protein CDQ83_09510 [Pseudoclostridium thermosuccinogenes]PNT96161.1 hypothetical protein CDQ85_12415 [Pseudoclostridium thermosuccinogenes]PNT97851.1 hypothetical protein CDQ84_12590 [Pseudoclostridium thermosuccinogenes]
MSKKRFLSAALGMLLLLTVSAPTVLAAGEVNVAPESIVSIQYVYINQASTSLTISSSGTATVYGYVQKTPAGKNIYLSSTLQRNSNGTWSDVKSWSTSSTSSSASILETYQVSSGTYRVETYYYVSGDGGYESGTIYSKTVTY